MYGILGEFSDWLKSKKYSKSTIDNYSRTLFFLDDYIRINSQSEKRIIYPEKIDFEDINQFVISNKVNGKNIKTINNYLAGIKMFLLFCKSKGLEVLDENKLIFTKEPEDNVESLNLNDISLFLNQLKNDINKPEILKIRDYAIGLMLVYGGLKVQELCDLKIKDLGENIQIIEKGKNVRIVPFKREYFKIIESYLSFRKDLGIDSEYVFISHSNNSLGNKLSRASVEEVIRKAGEKAGIGKVRPHKLRHTYAVLMLEKGEDRKTISQTLGYKNKQAAQRYFNHKISNQRK